MSQNNIDAAHAEIARTIRLAKKRMFKAHREGGPLALERARQAFMTEVNDVISQQDILLHAKDVDQSMSPGYRPQWRYEQDKESADEPLVKRCRDAMEELGLDWPTIDLIADAYLDTGDGSHLVLTIGLLQRLLTLERVRGEHYREGIYDLGNFLPLLIARLFRSTHQVENLAEEFATTAEAQLPHATRRGEEGEAS